MREQRVHVALLGQVGGHDLNVDAVRVAQFVGELHEHVFATGDDDQVVAGGGEVARHRLANAL